MNQRRVFIQRICSALLVALPVACTASEQQVADMAAQAQQLLDGGQPVQAQELIGRAVHKRDDLPTVFLVQARIAMALGKRNDAYRAYSNALALDATSPEALMGVARTGLNTGHLDEADKAADKILVLDPNQTEAMLIKGIVKMVHNNLDDTIAFSNKVLAIKSDDVGAIVLKSRALALQGDNAAAMALIDRGVARLGRTLELTMAQAELQRHSGNVDAFLNSLRRIKELAPQNRDYRFDLVDTLYRLGRLDEARAETASLIDEPNADLRETERYARLWYAYDQSALTVDQLASVAKKASVETRLALARFYVATGRGAVAVALLKPMATGWSSDIQAMYARATAAAGNTTAARQMAATALAKDPGNGAALLVQADAAMSRNDPTAAIIDYQKVIRDYPQWEEGYIGLAAAYLTLGKRDGARRTFEDALKTLPQSLLLARTYVEMLLRTGDKEHAREVARRFALNSPSLIAGWNLYSTICAQTNGDNCQAEAAEGLRQSKLRFGLDLAPGTPPPIALIGRLS